MAAANEAIIVAHCKQNQVFIYQKGPSAISLAPGKTVGGQAGKFIIAAMATAPGGNVAAFVLKDQKKARLYVAKIVSDAEGVIRLETPRHVLEMPKWHEEGDLKICEFSGALYVIVSYFESPNCVITRIQISGS